MDRDLEVSKRRPKPAAEARPLRRRWLQWLKWSVLAIALLVFADVVYAAVTLPSIPKGGFNPAQATMVYDMNGKEVGPLSGDVFRVPVGFKEIPEDLRNAYVASEDIRFYQHLGVDPRGIARALVTDIRAGEIREGGSTITQQVARMAFLSPKQNVNRKLQEMMLALLLERQYSKDEILTLYLNQAYLGNGAYGVGAGAQLYFSKSAADLTLGEAATLVGLTPSPERYNPLRDLQLATERRNVVLDRMVTAGYITTSQAEKEKAKPLKVRQGKPNLEYPHPWYMDAVREELETRYGLDDRMVDLMGLKVYTGLDVNAQTTAEKTIGGNGNFPKAPEGLEAAMAAIDPQTGEVRALIGGRHYSVQAGFNRATDLRRSPGSSIKPIISYAPAYEYAGMTPESKVDDSALDIGGWRPHNFDYKFHGEVTIREAARVSMNIPAIKLLDEVGVSKGRKFAEGLGLTFEPEDDSLTLALGGMSRGVSPLQMAAAYQAFANGGIYREPHLIVRVESIDGVIKVPAPESHQAMSPRTAYNVTDTLKTVIKSGTGTGASLPRPMAGKTGTSELPAIAEFEGKEGNTDAWFVGYTPDFAAAVWMGCDTTDRTHFLPPSVNGSTYPTRFWRQIASAALSNKPALEFPGPDGRMPKAPEPVQEEPQPEQKETTPPVVKDLTATPGSQPGSVTLSWKAEQVTGQAPENVQYYIYRGEGGQVVADQAHQVSSTTGTTAIDLPGKAGTYAYMVVAVDPKTGKQGTPSGVATVTVAETKPADGGTKPDDGGTKPSDGGTKPGDGGTKPGDGGTKPGDGGTGGSTGGTDSGGLIPPILKP